ncbi:MAG: hypothetical protein NTZ93_02180 [Candidatus Beckwithbacteria bacterium]|nr:hypothetical protein [Candidatus Beckwithbacteria bacterium]
MAISEHLREKAEHVLGESLTDRLVLPVQIMPERSGDPLGEALPSGLPAVLVFSEAAKREYENGNFKNLRLGYKRILSELRGDNKGKLGFFVEVGDSDCLAIGEVDKEGVKINLKEGGFVKFDPEKQKLGLKIITGREARNTINDFWAERFMINLEGEAVQSIDPRIEKLQEEIGLVDRTRENINRVFEREWMSPNYGSARLWGIKTEVDGETVELPVLVMTESGKQISQQLRPKILVEEAGQITTLDIEIIPGKRGQVRARKDGDEVDLFDNLGTNFLSASDIANNKLANMRDTERLRAVGIFVSERFGSLRTALLQVNLEKQTLRVFDEKGWLKDAAKLKEQIQMIEAEAEKNKARIVDLDNEETLKTAAWLENGDLNLFDYLDRRLGGGWGERVKDGVVGEKRSAFWENKDNQAVVKGIAWKAGYFYKNSLHNYSYGSVMSTQDEGKIVTTHMRVDIKGVSSRGLTEDRLESAGNKEDGVDVEIYVLLDKTIKVHVGNQAKDLKQPEEKQFWLKVLAGMKIDHS